MAGDEQVPPGPVPQRVHRLPDVPGYVAADVHDRVPAAVMQRRIVAGVAVADEPRHLGKQVSPGLAPAEQGHLSTSVQDVLDDGTAHERRAAQHK
jgi:hypothetical protein